MRVACTPCWSAWWKDISYDASEMNGQTVTIDAEYVSKHLDVLVADEDLSRFIL